MAPHTHDDIDWTARLDDMRRFDSLHSEALTAVAARLTADLPRDATVIDVGSGSGGMSAALASALRARGGGTVVLVDAVEPLLESARAAVTFAGGAAVRVHTIVADAASDDLPDLLPHANLIWASGVVHHLPDQQAAVNCLAGALAPRGRLALAEGGLDTRVLPWDLGFGEPGLEHRLDAAWDRWFAELRAGMVGVVSMSYGWTVALSNAGLTDIASFSYLVDHSAPASAIVRDAARARLVWLAEVADKHLHEEDRDMVRRLLDPDLPEYIGFRDDVYLLSARTVHTGRR
jgi:SAM-dependent methyltransferase